MEIISSLPCVPKFVTMTDHCFLPHPTETVAPSQKIGDWSYIVL